MNQSINTNHFGRHSHFIFSTMLLMTIWTTTVTGVHSQESDGPFETPVIPASKTLGGLPFGGDANQLEGIDGEAINAKATLQEPNFGEYGPVSGPRPTTQAADQPPSLPGKIEIIDQSTPLPNQYRAQTYEPDWLKSSSPQQEPNVADPVMRPIPQRSGGTSRPSSPRLRIDSLNDLQSENRKFSPDRPREIIRERYEDGNIKIVRTVTQDEAGNYYNDGGWLMYDRQQRPVASGTFVRGAMDGEWERIHEPGSGGLFSQIPFSLFEGPYKSSATFKRNKIDGIWRITDRNDKLICSISYKDGVRDGTATWFFPRNRQKMREANFKNGVPDGQVTQWNQQGQITSRDQFVDGRKLLTRKTTFANNSIESQRQFRDQQLAPIGTDNWWAAKPATFDRIGQPIQHGSVAQWYPNRQPKMSGRYVDGKRDGRFTWWHPTHNKKAEGEFVKGKRQGLWQYWHESGMKRSEGEFKDDQPFGLWRSWNRDGTLIDERTFPEEDEIQLPPITEDEPDSESKIPDEPSAVPDSETTDEEAKATEDSSDDSVIVIEMEENDPDQSASTRETENDVTPATPETEPLEDITAETVDINTDPGSISEGR